MIRRRWLAVAATITVIAGAFGLAVSTPFRAGPPTDPAASGSARPVRADGPLVYYEILDADASRLVERRLDGGSLARIVASRTDVASGPAWSLDPTGAVALVGAQPGPGDRRALVAFRVQDGAELWSTPIPPAAVADATWSQDGSQIAIAGDPDDQDHRPLLWVDAATGGLRTVDLPATATIHAFAADGGLILRDRRPDVEGVATDWRFLRVDPVTLAISRLAGLPDVRPDGDGVEAASPAGGFSIDHDEPAEEPGTAIRLRDLSRGTTRRLAVVPSVTRLAIDPAGAGIAFSTSGDIGFVTLAGQTGNVYHGEASVADFGWSTHADYLLVTTDGIPAGLTVVERATGRSISLPLPGRLAEAHFVGMVGGVALPADPLPAAEPTPTPTAGPSGPDVGGAPAVLAAWIDGSTSERIGHVQRLVPTEAGGLRVAAEAPPIDLGPAPVPDDGGPEIRLLPRPGSDEVLLWIAGPDDAHGLLWDGGADLRPVPLPKDWPENVGDVAWRPDGLAVAATAGRSTPDGEFEGIFAIATLGGARTTVVPIVGEYDRLEGWWSLTELRVGHGICTEGCAGRYAFSARLRIHDRRLTQLKPADRSHAQLDGAYFDNGRLVLSMINDDTADDVAIEWPAGLGEADDLDVLASPDIGTVAVARRTQGSTEILEIRDVFGRAVNGVLADPAPESLVTIPGVDLQIDLAPGGGWLLATDRVGGVRLIRMADGRAWSVDPDRALVWLRP